MLSIQAYTDYVEKQKGEDMPTSQEDIKCNQMTICKWVEVSVKSTLERNCGTEASIMEEKMRKCLRKGIN